MSYWQRISLATGDPVGEPGPLPREFQGNMSDADLARVGEIVPLELSEYADAGFVRVAAPAPEPEPRRITRIGFLQRIPADKRIGIRTAAKTDVVIEDFLDLMSATPLIELDHGDTQMGVGYLVSEGLLTSEEAGALLA